MSLCCSGVEMEVSPYIHPPFKIAMSRSNRLGVKDVVEFHASDMSRSSGVFVIELCCEFWCKDFGSGLPGVVFVAISFPLNEVLESSAVPTTVECHKLHSAISSPILRRFPRSQSELKALQKTFRSIPVTSRSNQYWPRY